MKNFYGLMKMTVIIAVLILGMGIMGCSGGDADTSYTTNDKGIETVESKTETTGDKSTRANLSGFVSCPDGEAVELSAVVLYTSSDSVFPSYVSRGDDKGFYGEEWFYCRDKYSQPVRVDSIPSGEVVAVAFDDNGAYAAKKLEIQAGSNKFDTVIDGTSQLQFLKNFSVRDNPEIITANTGKDSGFVKTIEKTFIERDKAAKSGNGSNLVTPGGNNNNDPDNNGNNLVTVKPWLKGTFFRANGTVPKQASVIIVENFPEKYPYYGSWPDADGNYGAKWKYFTGENEWVYVTELPVGEFEIFAIDFDTQQVMRDTIEILDQVNIYNIVMSKTEKMVETDWINWDELTK